MFAYMGSSRPGLLAMLAEAEEYRIPQQVWADNDAGCWTIKFRVPCKRSLTNADFGPFGKMVRMKNRPSFV